jgi:hypothetical protein
VSRENIEIVREVLDLINRAASGAVDERVFDLLAGREERAPGFAVASSIAVPDSCGERAHTRAARPLSATASRASKGSP